MRAARAVGPIVIGGVVLSAVIVLIAGSLFIRTQDLAGADKDWASFNGVIAIAFFALMVGLGSAVAATVLARWFPLGLLGLAAIAVGLGVYVTAVALDQKPLLAPMFIVLHVVFVGAFGLLLPYRLYMTSRGDAASARFPRP